MTSVQREFKKGVDHYLAERFAGAERSLRKVVKQDPKHADALHLLGLISLRSGQAKAGERRILQAIATAPDNPVYHGSLGAALREQGQAEAALAAYAQALALKVDYAIAWQNTAQIEADLGHTDAALTAYRRTLELAERDQVAHFGLANLQAEQGETAAAEGHYQRALEIDPDYVEAWNNLGNLLADTGRLTLGVAALKEAHLRRPDEAALPLNMAKKLEAGGHLDDARVAYLDALNIEPNNLAALAGLAALTAYLGDDKKAAVLYQRLAACDPDNPRIHAGIATWHENAGRLEAARDAAQAALAIAPGHPEATLALAQLDRRENKFDDARRRLEALDDDGEDGGIAFELGRILDRQGDYDTAFGAFERANAVLDEARNAGRFDGSAYCIMIDDIAATVTPDTVATWPGAADPVFDDGLAEPIFFVGFPRSGTTLMEQILDAHDDLVSLEELPLLEAARQLLSAESPYPTALTEITPEKISALRQVYWDAVSDTLEGPLGDRRLVDKLPLNIVHLGLIRRIFPRAKVLVALRDPRDVVLSCFMQSFTPNDAMVHFRNLEDSAKLYVQVMGNWRTQREFLGLDMFDYRYEDLVGNPGDVAGAVCRFLGLPWQANVLDYHARQRDRLVMTPSYQDVREAVYSRAVARWRHYADHLEPVNASLKPFVEAFGYSR